MKHCIFSLLLFLTGTPLIAQQFEQNTKFIALLGSADGLYIGNSFYGGKAVFEMGFREIGEEGIISIGGAAGFGTRNFDDLTLSDGSSQRGYAAVRSAFHYTALNEDKLDLYGGIELGFGLTRTRGIVSVGLVNVTNTNTVGFARFHPFVGARYYVANNIALMAESSLALFNGLQIGASFDF
jgi:hypothetical protein